MRTTFAIMALTAWLAIGAYAKGGVLSKSQERWAADYLRRAEKQLADRYNLDPLRVTTLERRVIAERALTNTRAAQGACAGIRLLKVYFNQVHGGKALPFWALAGLHHQIVLSFRRSEVGEMASYAKLLASRGVSPDVKALVMIEGDRLPEGCFDLYAELCFVVLRGVRIKSPVALKKLLKTKPRPDPVTELKTILNVAEDGPLQDWFSTLFEKATQPMIWGRKRVMQEFSKAISDLNPQDAGDDLSKKILRLSVTQPEAIRAFTADILRLAIKAPLVMRPSFGRLTPVLVKGYDRAKWVRALSSCWKELQPIDAMLADAQRRLTRLDLERRLRVLQRLESSPNPHLTSAERSVDRLLDSAEGLTKD